MLNRRHLRIKVMQALYAYFQSAHDNVDTGEKQLFANIDKFFDLYFYQLSFIIEVVKFAQNRTEEAKQKLLPTKNDLNPSMQFVENPLIHQIWHNKDFLLECNKRKIHWNDHKDIVRQVFNEFKESREYRNYMTIPECTYNEHKEIIYKLLKKYIWGNEMLQNFYEERSIYWVADYDIANLLILKTLKLYDEKSGEDHPFPNIPKNMPPDDLNEDIGFVKQLYRKSILSSKEFDNLIAEKSKNWDIERIALMDSILIKMALTELLDIQSIPIKVTLNEYIEISKEYSSEKSRVFLNGILDKLVIDLRQAGRIKKAGRGLME